MSKEDAPAYLPMDADLVAQYMRLSEPEALSTLIVDADGHIARASEQASVLFGIAEEQTLVGRAFADIASNDRDRERCRRALLTARRTKRPTPIDALHASQRVLDLVLWASPDGAQIHVVSRDVTERVRGYWRARLMQSTVHRAIEPLALLAPREGGFEDARIVFANHTLNKMLGYAPHELPGQRSRVLLPAGQSNESIDRAVESLAHGESAEMETALVRKNNSHVWVKGRLSVMRDPDVPERIFLALSCRDITFERRVQRQMMRAERVIAVGMIASDIGHEINNPLSYAKSNLDYCVEIWGDIKEILHDVEDARLDDLREDIEGFGEAISEATDGVDRTCRIASNLRALSNMQDATKDAVELEAVIRAAASLARTTLRGHAQLDLRLDKAPRVHGNEAQLAQLFLNLLLNAADAIEPGHAHENVVRITFTEKPAQNSVIVDLSDTGSGIPKDHLTRIFDPFFSTRANAANTGLGLTICQTIAHAHRGTIRALSVEGKGATFRITLPLYQPHTAISEPSLVQMPEDGDLLERLRVAVIDDEWPILRVIKRLLSRHHDVMLYDSALDALTSMTRASDPGVDIILCDLAMPDIDGLTFFELLCDRAPHLRSRVFFLTGGTLDKGQQDMINEHGVPVIYKPFSKKALLDTISKLFLSQRE